MELTIGDKDYRTGKLNAKQQFHVARRLAPVIAKIGAVNGKEEAEGSSLIFGALAESIASLSDRDCDYIISMCMSTVMRKQGDRWAPVWNTAADRPQFDDMNLPELMQLTYSVIQDNLVGFIPAQGLPGLPANISPPNAQ